MYVCHFFMLSILDFRGWFRDQCYVGHCSGVLYSGLQIVRRGIHRFQFASGTDEEFQLPDLSLGW